MYHHYISRLNRCDSNYLSLLPVPATFYKQPYLQVTCGHTLYSDTYRYIYSYSFTFNSLMTFLLKTHSDGTLQHSVTSPTGTSRFFSISLTSNNNQTELILPIWHHWTMYVLDRIPIWHRWRSRNLRGNCNSATRSNFLSTDHSRD